MRRYYLQIIDFDGLSNDLWLKQSTETLGAVGDTEKASVIQKPPESISQELDVKDNTSTVSSIFITAVNVSDELSELIYENYYKANNFYDKKCVVGYYDTVTTTTTEIYTGYLEDITSDTYETYYKFKLKDGIEKLKALSLEKTSADSDVFDILTALSETPTQPPALEGTFVRFGRKESTTTTYLYGYEDTTTQGTFTGWTEQKWIVLSYTGHPIYLAEYLCNALSVEYDSTSFDAVRTDTKNALITSFYFEWKEPIKDTYNFMVEQIFKPCNCYPLIKGDGKLYLGLHKQPTTLAIPTVLNESNSKIKSITQTRSNLINNGFIGLDYNIEKDEYFALVYDKEDANTTFETDSVLAFGLQPKEADTIGFEGANPKATINSTTDLADRITFARNSLQYLFDRFALATKLIELEVISSIGEGLVIGDLVIIQGFKLMQWKGDGKGTRGLPVVSTDEYGKVDSSYWGDYVNTYENNLFLDDYSAGSIEVLEIITLGFFEGLQDNFDYNETFLTQHGA